MALIGVRWNDYSKPREDKWNQEVLHSPAGAAADAATLHIYCGWDSTANSSDPLNIGSHLAVAATRAWNNGMHAQRSIPPHMEVWVTEMGVYPPGPLDGTWLHAMFYLAMDLLLPAAIPTLTVLTPYCLMCADPTAPAFTTEKYGPVIPPDLSGTIPILASPTGEIQRILFRAVRNATQMTPLAFEPNPVLAAQEQRSRVLIGWALTGSQDRAVLLNQGDRAVPLAFPSILSISKAECTYPRHVSDVTKQGLHVSELGRISPAVANGTIRVPAYGICTFS